MKTITKVIVTPPDQSTKITFLHLGLGQYFMYGEQLYMKVFSHEIGLGERNTINFSNSNDGLHTYFCNDTVVTPVKELIITPSL
jgi:hypothetical protein